jgi:hypothetical protein
MSRHFDKIKKSLSMSTTLPLGTAGAGLPLMGSTHVHKADGSCCGHDHHHHTDHHHDGGCCDHDHDEDDTTNPKGGCC